MRPRQNQDDDGDLGPSRRIIGRTHGFLEDPNRVRQQLDLDVFVNDRHTAAFTEAVSSGFFTQPNGFECVLYLFRCMRWTHVASLLHMEGAGKQQLLGPDVVVLSFHERPVYDPLPGLNDVLVACVLKKPPEFDTREVFFRLHDAFLRGDVRLETTTPDVSQFDLFSGVVT
jgi:hypothetical protein